MRQSAFSDVPEGVLRFNVDMVIDLDEMKAWPPDLIVAFFKGLSLVVSARRAALRHIAESGK